MAKVTPKPLRSTFIDTVPMKPGVYIIWITNAVGGLTVLYVGMSKVSIRTRLYNHLRHADNDHLKKYVLAYGPLLKFCYSIRNPSRIKAKETRLIKKLCPKTNISENS